MRAKTRSPGSRRSSPTIRSTPRVRASERARARNRGRPTRDRMPARAENFAAGLPALAARSPDATALVVQGRTGVRDERTTWRELADRAARMAHGLTAAGVQRGDRVSVFLRPGRDWL